VPYELQLGGLDGIRCPPADERRSRIVLGGPEEAGLERGPELEERRDEGTRPQEYTDVGTRVSGILAAAEQAAEEIRADARRQAAETLRKAEDEAQVRIDELTRSAERVRGEADDYARDIRTAVDSFGTQQRREAEEEVRTILADAEAQARAVREAAQEMAEQIEGDARRRHQTLQNEARALEERRQRVLESLRDIAAQLQDALVEPTRRGEADSLIDALDVEQRR
jgi:cell division septum initiation protein DivIVA